MAGRPRKKQTKKTRSRNGTGTITTYYQKIDRKDKRLKTICKICEKCTHQELCNYRKGSMKCEVCNLCTNIEDCDRFYIYSRNVTLAPQQRGQKRKYLGSFDDKKDAQESIDKSKNGGFIDKDETKVYEILEKIEENKLKANAIKEETYIRNKSVINKICRYGLGNLKVQNVTTEDVQNYLNEIAVFSSKSELDKNKSELQQCFKYAQKHNMITENPFDNDDFINVRSNKPKKVAEPFTFEQREKLFDYLDNNKNLTDIKANVDSITFKNVVKLAFYTGQRIGELLGLQEDDISFEQEDFGISKVATREHTLREGTKNSDKRVRKGLPIEVRISFDYAPKDIIKNIFLEQLEHSRKCKGNKLKLVFCNKDGSVISGVQITNALRVICENINIRPQKYKHCHIHQARHTFVVSCLEAGISVEVVADLIGDEIEEVQKTYAHILPKYKKEQLKKLQEYYQK